MRAPQGLIQMYVDHFGSFRDRGSRPRWSSHRFGPSPGDHSRVTDSRNQADPRGHDDPQIRVRDCTRGHVGVRTATPSRRFWTVRPRFKSRVPDQVFELSTTKRRKAAGEVGMPQSAPLKSTAQAATCARDLTPSLFRMCSRWASTVLSDNPNRTAICALVNR